VLKLIADRPKDRQDLLGLVALPDYAGLPAQNRNERDVTAIRT
jgi:hypothetical protein